MCQKSITRVSGKPNVIKINGVETKFSSIEALDEAWGRLVLNGYSVPKNNASDFTDRWP